MTEPPLLAGRYECGSLPGEEGTCRAWDRLTEREVVLRTLRVDREEERARFEHEVRTLVRIHHPFLMEVRDVVVDDGRSWVTLSILPEEGPTLDQVLAEEGRLKVLRATRIAAELGWALSLLHNEGIAYGDLDPTRVHLRPSDGGGMTARLGGLDRVRCRGDGAVWRGRRLPGDPRYLSPEQVLGGEATPAGDLFALGCILYRMLAGRSPSEGPNPVETAARASVLDSPEIVPSRFGVPRRVKGILRDLLRRDPARRPRHTSILASRLDAAWEAARILPWHR